jgi:glyoxylase-like metal-dependent hydrolase (beta-lactamase superfamily II)
MGEYLLSVDAGGGTAVVEGELAELDKLTDGKPLKYSVITHHHSDHTNGVDALAATGSTILADESIHAYLAGIVRDRHFAGANTTRAMPAEPKLVALEEKQVIGDGGRRIEIYRVPNAHAEDYYVVYLPAEKILYGADVFNFPPTGPLPPANDNFNTFWDNFTPLGLEVETVANAHGRLGTWQELEARAQTRVAAK